MNRQRSNLYAMMSVGYNPTAPAALSFNLQPMPVAGLILSTTSTPDQCIGFGTQTPRLFDAAACFADKPACLYGFLVNAIREPPCIFDDVSAYCCEFLCIV
jgi:hypothetical protein